MNSMLGYIVDCNAVEMCIEFQTRHKQNCSFHGFAKPGLFSIVFQNRGL